jgi:pentatricopeptide repeat protein
MGCREMVRADLQPDRYTLVAILTAAGRNGRVAVREVDAIVQHMRRLGVETNTHVCASLMSAYRNCRGPDNYARCMRCEHVLSQMLRLGIPVNAEVMHVLIQVYADAEQHKKVLDVYDRMIQMRIIPTSTTYKIMIDACMAAGDSEQAREFMELQNTMKCLIGELKSSEELNILDS